jgi:hypothetical protein
MTGIFVQFVRREIWDHGIGTKNETFNVEFKSGIGFVHAVGRRKRSIYSLSAKEEEHR